MGRKDHGRLRSGGLGVACGTAESGTFTAALPEMAALAARFCLKFQHWSNRRSHHEKDCPVLRDGRAGGVRSGRRRQEIGRVISSTPVIQQVAVPRQVCNNQPMAVQQPNSGAGARVGRHRGRCCSATRSAMATAAPPPPCSASVGGAVRGQQHRRPGAAHVQNVQQCTTQTFYENRTVGYNVHLRIRRQAIHRADALRPGPDHPAAADADGATAAPPLRPRLPAPAPAALRWASSWAPPVAQPR